MPCPSTVYSPPSQWSQVSSLPARDAGKWSPWPLAGEGRNSLNIRKVFKRWCMAMAKQMSTHTQGGNTCRIVLCHSSPSVTQPFPLLSHIGRASQAACIVLLLLICPFSQRQQTPLATSLPVENAVAFPNMYMLFPTALCLNRW